MSIPIPNSGNYTGTPVDVVTTAVAHISHLVDALSASLNIPLPHPLLPFEATDSMISAQQDLWARAQVKDCCYSLSPAAFMHDRSRFKDFDWTTLNELPTVPPPPEDPSTSVEGLPASASATPALPRAAFDQQVVVNSGINGEVREYAINSNFSAALVLLQANVVSLCLKAGLEAEALWPAEAMLLNLHLLKQLCEQAVKRGGSLLASTQEVPLVFSPSPQGQPVLASIRDRYGSLAATQRKTFGESIVMLQQGGPAVRADFSPERSGLARDEEWDIIHMS